MANPVKEASQRRLKVTVPPKVSVEDQIEHRLNLAMDELLLNAARTGPHARHKLRGLLRYYAKKPHPFRACVRDNMKRFGPGRTEAICATLKDIIRGTTHWRGHPSQDHGAPGAVAASEVFEIDDDLAILLSEITDEQIEKAQEILEGGSE